MIAVGLLIGLAGLPLLACAGYLFALSVLARRRPAPPCAEPHLKFDVIVPAHDEEASIARTVKSLLSTDYPAALRRVLVVADNCTDRTAATAAAAGAVVLERTDPARRGKGYALAHAFEHSLREGFAGALVVVDADTLVSQNLLRAFAARFDAGAGAVQAEYGVANPDASWRTRLMSIAFTLFHVLRSLARERLGVSAGLRGNGMAFSAELVRAIPYDAFSVVEDVEYGIRLGRAGHRVHYAAEAQVFGEMVASEKASRSQRRRWEGGRLALAREQGFPLLVKGLRTRSGLLLDLAADVLVPPLSYLAAAALGGTGVAMAVALRYDAAWLGVAPWALAAFFVAFYVFRGWMLSGSGARGVLALLWAPVYVAWKLGLSLRRSSHKKGEWVRTAREGEEP